MHCLSFALILYRSIFDWSRFDRCAMVIRMNEEFYNAIQKQMLDKMMYYRGMLLKVVGHIDGTNRITKSEIREMIMHELRINPKWEVLQNIPHFIPMNQDPDCYKAINTGPPPKP